jgi:hypothetical protein
MSYVSLRELGDCNVGWILPAESYERILQQLESGATWLTFRTKDGCDAHLRADSVASLAFVSDEAEAAVEARAARERLNE